MPAKHPSRSASRKSAVKTGRPVRHKASDGVASRSKAAKTPNASAAPAAVARQIPPASAGLSFRHLLRLLSLPLIVPLTWLWDAKWRLFYLALLLASILILPAESARLSTQGDRYGSSTAQLGAVPHRDVALVLGSAAVPVGQADSYQPALRTAAALYALHKVNKVLVSGSELGKDGSAAGSKYYARQLGIAASDVLVDPAPTSTYDSCLRAATVYKASSAAVVTPGYHLPLAIFSCQQLGLDAVGVAEVQPGRDWTAIGLAREQFSTLKSYIQLMLKQHIGAPQPKTTTTITTTTTMTAPADVPAD